MNKKLKTRLILVFVFILFFGILLAIPTIDNYISDQKTLEYQKYSKQGDDFVYDFKLDETYSYLEEVVTEYNKEFGYDTENKILMGKGKKEIVFAEYDENSITIYCENTVNSKLTDKQIAKYLSVLFENYSNYEEDYTYNFLHDLTDYHEGIAAIVLPIIIKSMNPAMANIYSISKLIIPFIGIIDIIIIISSLIYLICFIIYILKNRRQENFIIPKKKKVLFISVILFSILFIILGGFSGIILMVL